MIEIVEGMWFNPDQIVAVKSIAKDRCILWTTGQPATEGHVLEYWQIRWLTQSNPAMTMTGMKT